MIEYRTTKIYSKIKMKNRIRFKYCFYYVYDSFFIVLCCFFCKFLHTNMFIVSVTSKRVFVSLNKFLAPYKPNTLIQY